MIRNAKRKERDVRDRASDNSRIDRVGKAKIGSEVGDLETGLLLETI